MLKGKNVNLKVLEKEELALLTEWVNNLEYIGEYTRHLQQSKTEAEKFYDKLTPKEKWFFIEKKDGSKIGFISHFSQEECLGIGYFLIPSERGKGYCAEAVKIMVDYLFLSKDIVRVQAETDVRNVISQKVLEKVGFNKEGTIRKSSFIGGEWRDMFLYSILREEWKEPKILAKVTSC